MQSYGDPNATGVQGFTLWLFAGLVNFIIAVAYHFCLNLLVAFSQPGDGLTFLPCREQAHKMEL